MGYKYSVTSDNPTPYIPFNVIRSMPIEERSVIETRMDLINPETWGGYDRTGTPKNYTYDGIIVTVVDDPEPTNNGVYYLWRRNYFDKFADIDETDPDYSTLYDQRGWRKIDGNGTTPGPSQVNVDQYTIKEGTEEYLPADEQVPGLHVVRIDGGNFH